MEGRRVNHSAPKRNPLYVMFLCLVAAVFVLLIVVIVLGAKLGAAQKAAKGAETQIEELQEQVKKLEEEKDAANEPDEKLPGRGYARGRSERDEGAGYERERQQEEGRLAGPHGSQRGHGAAREGVQ